MLTPAPDLKLLMRFLGIDADHVPNLVQSDRKPVNAVRHQIFIDDFIIDVEYDRIHSFAGYAKAESGILILLILRRNFRIQPRDKRVVPQAVEGRIHKHIFRLAVGDDLSKEPSVYEAGYHCCAAGN